MADINTRRLPVGIQSFKVIREENYLYVDKSDIVWNLVNLGQKYNYLSRPRRFGKSVLVDTLEAYLQGRKDLFEGLKIMEMEKEWRRDRDTSCHELKHRSFLQCTCKRQIH